MIRRLNHLRLSLIIGARNDGYMGNFTWRFETALNYLADNLRRLGRLDDVEVVVTDWGSEMPLHTVLSLHPSAKRILRFVLIPPALAGELQGDSEFPIVLAQNAAIRRSGGEYIGQTDSDILFTKEFLEQLFEILDGQGAIGVPSDGAMLISKRRQVPWKYVTQCLSIHELDWFIHRLGPFLPVDRIFPVPRLKVYTPTGLVIMHRRRWNECKGYDERLVHWGWMDIDLALRIARKYSLIFLDTVGVPEVFHLEHYRPLTRFRPRRKPNPTDPDNLYCPNGDLWGLRMYPLQEYVYHCDAEEKEIGDPEEQQCIHLSYKLVSLTATVMLGSVWRHLTEAIISPLQKLMPKRVTAFFSLWGGRAVVAWIHLQGQPMKQWPVLLRKLWTERQLRKWTRS